MSAAPARPEGSQRLDKWLWSARFFKTRGLATEAIHGGRVELNGQRCKPAKAVRPGDLVRISREDWPIEVRVLALAARRGPASEARQLYEETEASVAAHQKRAEQRQRVATDPVSRRRPSKRDRRLIRGMRELGED